MTSIADSYSLREVAELLGVSKRTLQRRIQEGAFPGRFLAAGRHGLETRIPAEDLERALEELRRRSPAWRAGAGEEAARIPTATPVREQESLVPYHHPYPTAERYETPEIVAASSGLDRSPTSALTQSDLESLRDAMLAIVREDREMYLAAVREAMMVRDREIGGLKAELSGMRRVLDSVRAGLEGLELRLASGRDTEQVSGSEWADLMIGPNLRRGHSSVDVDALMREIGELELLIGALDGDA
jgi:excisionase family DNA binding protein